MKERMYVEREVREARMEEHVGGGGKGDCRDQGVGGLDRWEGR